MTSCVRATSSSHNGGTQLATDRTIEVASERPDQRPPGNGAARFACGGWRATSERPRMEPGRRPARPSRAARRARARRPPPRPRRLRRRRQARPRRHDHRADRNPRHQHRNPDSQPGDVPPRLTITPTVSADRPGQPGVLCQQGSSACQFVPDCARNRAHQRSPADSEPSHCWSRS
jgi:hypothetical protein